MNSIIINIFNLCKCIDGFNLGKYSTSLVEKGSRLDCWPRHHLAVVVGMDWPHPIGQAAVEAVVDVAVAVVVAEVVMTLGSPTDIAAVVADNPDYTHHNHFVLDRYSFRPYLDLAVRLNIPNDFYNYHRPVADLAANTFDTLSLADRP